MEPSTSRITAEDVDDIINAGKIETTKMGRKTTVCLFTSKEGFEIVASSSCVDPKAYSSTKGERLCVEKIRDRIFELEGYLLHTLHNVGSD